MILLDTNYLIGMLVRDSRESEEVVEWYRKEDLCTSSVCWYEFLRGPPPSMKARCAFIAHRTWSPQKWKGRPCRDGRVDRR